jgi:RHS repeat-associated protein
MIPFSINPNAGSGIVTPSSDNVLVSANAMHTYSFMVTDTSSHTANGVTLSITGCSGAVSSCSVSPTSVSIGAGFSASVTVTYYTGASGTGTITLMAHWPSQLNTYGTLNVRLPTAPPVVTVSPDPQYTAENFATNDPYFSIRNNGNSASTYALSASCSGNISACSVSSPSANVSPGGSVGATVYYTTGAFTSGNGTATLTATSTLTGESSSTSVTVVPLSSAVSVTPDGGTATTNPGTGASAAFTVTDVGNSSPTTYSLSCGYSGAITSCSVTPSVQVYIGSPQSVNVSYTTSSNLAGGTGTVTLTASASGVHTYTDGGSYTVTVPDQRTYNVSVTPDGATAYSEQSVSTNYVFTVTDVGNAGASYTLTIPACSGTASGCSFSSGGSVTTTTVSAGGGGGTVSVPVYFTSGGVGQNASITLAASGATNSDNGSVQVVTLAPTVQVTPVAPSANAQTNASGTYAFNVHNAGSSGQITYTLQVTGCTAPLTGCAAPGSITVAQGADSVVYVSFQTQTTSGTGNISLRAFKTFVNTYESTGTGTVNVNSRLSVSTAFMNNDDQDMSLCVASCFAMTASRSTVPYYTLDTPRNVTLVYNGDRAFPRPFVYADVVDSTAPGGAVQNYTLEVRRNGVDLPFTNGETKLTFAGTTSPAATFRLAAQLDMSSEYSRIDSATVLVTALYANGQSDVTSVKTQLMIVNSTLNADAAPVAKGWRIAGMQFFRPTPEGLGSPGGGYMVENGDGSATYFASNGAMGADFSTLAFDNVSMWIRTYQDGSKVQFDGGGRMLAAIDRLGRKTTFSYGGAGNWSLVGITEPMRSSGSSTSAPYIALAYDGNNRLSAITETGGTGGRTTNITVDANGYLTRITDPDGGYDSYGYDGSGRLNTITDRRGSTTTYSYGATWKLSQVVSPAVPVDAHNGGTTTATPTTSLAPWQSVGVPLSATATNPAPILEADTIAARVTDPNGYVSTLYPNRWGEAVKTIDALGNATTVGYQGFLATSITYPDGSADSASYNTSNGLLLTARAAGQQSVSYTYGNMNQLQTVSGAGVVTTTNTLDSLGRVIKTAYGSVPGDTTTFTYDPVTKNVSTTLQPNVGLTTYQYDPVLGNTEIQTAPGSRVTQTYFDAYGRDTATKAPQFPTSRKHYDILNRVTAAFDGAIGTDSVSIKYDAILPVALRDPSSHVDSTEYDALGRTARHFGYASTAVPTTIRYDNAGEATSSTNRRGQRIDVTYDPLGRVLTKTADGATDQFTYSANGLTQTASNATGSVRMVSVPTALLDSVQTTISASGVVQHTYTVVHYQSKDAGGTDSTTISSDGAPASLVTRRYVNDATNGALKAIDLGSTIGQGTFTSDVAGWRTATNWPTAGRSSAFLSTGVHAYETYGSLDYKFYAGYRVDSAGRILRDHRPDGGSSYNNHIFGYDTLGRYTGTTTVSESKVPWACGGSGRFDPNYGQVGCAIDSVPRPYVYSYDGAGNRVGSGITNSGVGDQVATSDGFSYTYDDDGNVLTRSQSSTGLVWNYTWSSDNKLLSSSSTFYGSPAKATSFDYDALGRPVVKRDGSGHAIRVTLYDGAAVLADLDASGNREAEYVYDEGTDRPYAMLTGATTVTGVRYYAQDDMGNVNGQFQNSKTPTQTVTYGDWGLPEVTGDTTNRLTWKGLSYDPDVGLIYVRARWYDPNIGRFVSEDPLGLQAGINPYVFANNDPINGTDPSGMDEYLVCTIQHNYGYVNGAYTGDSPTITCTISGSGGATTTQGPPSDPSGGEVGGGGTVTPVPPAIPCRTGGGTPFQPNHRARDYHLSGYGVPIPAPANGVVIAGRATGFYVPIPNGVDYSKSAPAGSTDFVDFRTTDNYLIRYVHVRPTITFFAPVQAGQPIGVSDQTGRISGPHTHIQVTTPAGTRIDPNQYFKGCH